MYCPERSSSGWCFEKYSFITPERMEPCRSTLRSTTSGRTLMVTPASSIGGSSDSAGLATAFVSATSSADTRKRWSASAHSDSRCAS